VVRQGCHAGVQPWLSKDTDEAVSGEFEVVPATAKPGWTAGVADHRPSAAAPLVAFIAR
jgi:hypothetical protein